MSTLHKLLLGILVTFGLIAGAQAQGKQVDYRLGAGDAIKISVFQNPDLTVETRVAESGAVTYPLIGDKDLTVAKLYDMIHPNASGEQKRTAADNATVRSVFLVGPDKKIKAMLTYPMSTGRNFDEVLRLLDSCQLTAKHKVATPVNWKQGQDVIIVPSVPDEEAKQKFPQGWKAPKPYLRIVPQPK